MQFFHIKKSSFLFINNKEDAVSHNSLERFFALIFKFFEHEILFLNLSSGKYSVALEESTYVLMSSRTSAWIFFHKFSAHLQTKLP